ncbi:MAG: WXG100 family type VII secretion target [Bifidobacterium sp.]
MNASITYPFIPGLGFNLINTLASTPGMPCHCRAGVRTTQAARSMPELTSASRHLDDLDATLASSSLPDWTGTAAESYRARLDELRKQSLALRDSLNATSRILWSVGAA